jgi:hypothetical protein
MQQDSIISTNLEGIGLEKGGSSNLLRNILITLGVIGLGVGIGVATSGGGHTTTPPPATFTPPPDNVGGTRPH